MAVNTLLDSARSAGYDTLFVSDGSALNNRFCAYSVTTYDNDQLLYHGASLPLAKNNMEAELVGLVQAVLLAKNHSNVLVATDCVSLLELLSSGKYDRLESHRAVRVGMVNMNELEVLFEAAESNSKLLAHVKAHDGWVNNDKVGELNHHADQHARKLAHELRVTTVTSRGDSSHPMYSLVNHYQE